MTREDIIQRFADWCTTWAGEEPSNETRLDYVDHNEVVYDDGWFVVLNVNMGAFDHGAGNCLLIAQDGKQWVAYEGKMTLFAEGKDLKTLPK
jgi:hypothetical protein